MIAVHETRDAVAAYQLATSYEIFAPQLSAVSVTPCMVEVTGDHECGFRANISTGSDIDISAPAEYREQIGNDVKQRTR